MAGSASGDLLVRNARAHPTPGRSDAGLHDIEVRDGTITSIQPAGQPQWPHEGTVLNADGRLLSPPFVDPHIHLDTVLTVGEPRHNQSGTLIEGILTWSERKKSLSLEDVKRMRYAISATASSSVSMLSS